MNFTTLMFDLDDTLYLASTGLWDLIGNRIDLFIQQRLNLSSENSASLRKRLFHQYGTTLQGLQIEYAVPAEEYLRFVHDVPVEDLLRPDPDLQQLLKKLPQRKIIFTNANLEHVNRVIRVLGVEDCFEKTIDIMDVAPFCKPQSGAFEIALKESSIFKNDECAVIDDTPSNLETAQALGLFPILVGEKPNPGFASHIPTIHQLDDLLDHL